MRGALVASCTLLGAAACGFSSTAAAIDGASGSGSGSGHADARIDAPAPDASNLFTLSQSTSDVQDGHSLGCASDTPANPDTDNINRANTFYRVFDLAAVIPATSTSTLLHIDDVRFVLQLTQAGANGEQPVNIELATYSGDVGDTIDLDAIDAVKDTSIMAADSTSDLTVPIAADFSPTDKLVISINFPDGTADGNRIKIGTNAAGESGHSYWYAPDCKIGTAPQGDSAVWFQKYIDDKHLTGSHGDAIIEAHGHF